MASVEGSIQSLTETVALQRTRADEAEAKAVELQRRLNAIHSVASYYRDNGVWDQNGLLAKFCAAVLMHTYG